MAYTPALKAAQAKYYQANKEERLAKVRERQKRIKQEIQEYKVSIGCDRCGYSKCARSLQFHHHDDNKEGNISRWVTQGRAMSKIMEEINKCILLCANCHGEEHEVLEGSFTG